MGTICSQCQHENPENTLYCGKCGSPTKPEERLHLTKTILAGTDTLQKGQIFADRYRIVEELGRGGMGVVYKAEDTKLKRSVALKFLPSELTHVPDIRERFQREAQAAASLDHPNICTVFEFDKAEETSFISMAYIEGESLKEKVDAAPLELDATLKIITQVAEGLKEAHKKGIIHRDIKSANIMVTESGQTKIMDFGLARTAGSTLLTQEGTTMGTVAYMSPEQVQGEEVDHRSDIWSFGVVLYEMLTGKLPFQGEREQAVFHSILNTKPKPLSDIRDDIPATIEQVVSKTLEKSKDKRYQQIDELLEDLRSISAGIVPEEIKTRLRKAKFRKRKRIFLSIGVPVLIILAVVLGLTVFTGQVEAIESIAVLPLENLTGDAEKDYFAKGATDELIGQLGRVSALRVISRQSMMRYQGSDKSLPEIARELNVDAVVEGTVREAGDNVHIRVQLIATHPQERNIWGQAYDSPIQDVMVMYADMVRSITENISVELTDSEKTRLAGAEQIDPEAYDAYLKGLDLQYRLGKEDLEKAIEYFEDAINKAPNWALPYIGLSQTWGFLNQMNWVQVTVALPKMYKNLYKAMQLDPDIDGVHQELAAKAVWMEWDWEKGEKEFLKAIELSPNDAQNRALYSHFLFIMNRPEEGARQANLAYALDPLNPLVLGLVGMTKIFAGDFEAARDYSQKALSIAPGHYFANTTLTDAYYGLGEMDNWFETWKKIAWWDDEVLAEIDKIYYSQGFQAAIEKIIKVNEKAAVTGNISDTGQAVRYLYINKIEEALDSLEKAYLAHNPNLPYLNPGYAKPFPVLRDHPRFQILLEKMKLPPLKE